MSMVRNIGIGTAFRPFRNGNGGHRDTLTGGNGGCLESARFGGGTAVISDWNGKSADFLCWNGKLQRFFVLERQVAEPQLFGEEGEDAQKTHKKLNSGKVVAVGPGCHNKEGKLISVNLKEGDTVLLPEYGGTEVKLGEKEYHLYREDDVLGTLHE